MPSHPDRVRRQYPPMLLNEEQPGDLEYDLIGYGVIAWNAMAVAGLIAIALHWVGVF